MSDAHTIVGGYVLARAVPRNQWQEQQLIPAEFLTVSRCLDDTPRPEFYSWFLTPEDAGWVGAALDPRPRLLTVGLRPADAQALLEVESADSTPTDATTDFGPFQLLATAAPMPGDARLLGFEVVGLGWALSEFHSWLCHSYEREVWETLGIRPNAVGLLDTYEQASAIVTWMEDQPPDKAPEPMFWTAVTIAELPLPGRGSAEG
ncbi:hypothetical protein [Streptomyces sp. RFCAC02]|uniref:hypothetical protein n=1 Tax=Streptomyces sp. RFCAC02 TaxID=2499143 RepID=UPI00101F53BC|nr:hypothetical protein [Streptomyces sp. RFCAC02]